MNTLPAPSTASPVKAASPATKTRWSAAWPGTCSTANGPKRSPSPSATSAGWRIAPTGEPPSASRRAVDALGVVRVVVRERDAAGAAARGRGRGDRRDVAGQRRPGIDDPRGIAPHDPRVGAVERERRRVRRPDERHLHGLSAARAGRPARRARRRRRGPARPRRRRRGCRRAATCCARPLRPAGREPRGLDHAAAEVAEHVAPVEVEPRVAHDHAARDRAVAVAVRADDHRRDVAGRRLAGRVARAALERPPAEVRAAPAAARHEVDLLVLVLADVADREVARAAVEREAPRVAQAVRVDLAARPGAADERVRRPESSRRARPPARGSMRRILPSSEPEVLRVAARAVPVAGAAAVARCRRRAGGRARRAAGRRCGWTRSRPCAARAAPSRRRRAPRRGARYSTIRWSPSLSGVVDVEAAAARVVRREGEREQALLPAGGDERADVEERLRRACARRARPSRGRPARPRTGAACRRGGDVR